MAHLNTWLGCGILFHSYDYFSFGVSCFKIPDRFSRFP